MITKKRFFSFIFLKRFAFQIWVGQRFFLCWVFKKNIIQTFTTGLSTYDFVRMASKTSGLSVRLPDMPAIIQLLTYNMLRNPSWLNIREGVRKKYNYTNSHLHGNCVRDYVDKFLHLVCFCLSYVILFTFSSCCLFKLPLQPPATTRLGTEFALFVRFL